MSNKWKSFLLVTPTKFFNYLFFAQFFDYGVARTIFSKSKHKLCCDVVIHTISCYKNHKQKTTATILQHQRIPFTFADVLENKTREKKTAKISFVFVSSELLVCWSVCFIILMVLALRKSLTLTLWERWASKCR